MDNKSVDFNDVRRVFNQLAALPTEEPEMDNPTKASQEDSMGKDPKEEMPAMEEPTGDAAPAGAMSAAMIAEKAGVSEEELMAFLEQSGLLEKAGGMEGLLAAVAQDPEMLDTLVMLIKQSQGGATNPNAIPIA